MKRLISLFFLVVISNAVSASDLNVDIKSYEGYVAYTKVITSLITTKQCSESDSLVLQIELKKLNVSDDLLISKYRSLNEYGCSVLEATYNMLVSNQSVVLKKYPPPKYTDVDILSVDKNTAAHNVMVGNVKKGSWVVCYGLDTNGIPLAKNTSLVKSKYTAVHLRSTKFHDEIVKYECELED
jgi:hypothetical protein